MTSSARANQAHTRDGDSNHRAITLSQNELEALCFKAARGAGMCWGLGEEAGFATAWLTSRGILGPVLLLRHLQYISATAPQEVTPVAVTGGWRAAQDHMLCPIALGAALHDFAELPEGDCKSKDLRLATTHQPGLILPFLAKIATDRYFDLSLMWSGGEVIFQKNGVICGDFAAFCALEQAEMTLRASQQMLPPVALEARPGIDCETITSLSALALQTTVPPSEKSRADAGSAGSDND